MARKAIVLAANAAYSNQVMTMIKSISLHNHGIRFYLINSDFPNEWFRALSKKLALIGSEIIDARVDASLVSGFHTEISYTTFLRYFIPDFVEEDRVLYFDCDMVVTGALDELFIVDLEDNYVAAVQDYGGKVYFNRYPYFNAGMLVVNNRLWKDEQLSQKLIEMTNELHDQVPEADQSILNILFEHRWLELPFRYNYIGIHSMFVNDALEAGKFPTVIHYLTHRKPWKWEHKSTYRELWWYYRDLEWADIINIGALPRLYPSQLRKEFDLEALIFTSSGDIEHLETLIRELPQVRFTIGAYSTFSGYINALIRYPNVTLAPALNGLTSVIQEMAERTDVLLDIYYGEEVGTTVSDFVKQGKPVFAFESTAHGEQGQQVFPSSEPEQMIEAIKELVEKSRKD